MTCSAIAGVVGGAALQVWLLNRAFFEFWAAGVSTGSRKQQHFGYGLFGLAACCLIFLGQITLVWFAFVRPALRFRGGIDRGRCRYCGYDLTGNTSW